MSDNMHIHPEQRPPRRSIPVQYIILALVLIGLGAMVLSGFYVVDQTEQAVVLRFGRFNRITGPGLQLKIPFGIETSTAVPTQKIQTMSFGYRTEKAGINTVYSDRDYSSESVMLTGDLNIVDVEWVIQYRINDPQAWLFNVEHRTKTIRDISQSVINQLVGDRAILDVIGPERENIETQGKDMMNKEFKSYGLGIKVTTVQLKNIVPPQGEVQDAFEDVNKAIQDMNRLINEGKEAYNKEIPLADGQAAQMLNVAEGYAAERVNNAEGEVARFKAVLEEYNKNKEVTRSRLYYEMFEDVFKSSEGTTLIDRNLDNFLPMTNVDSQGSTGGAE